MSIFKGKNGPFLIAEIGGNHEGDFDYAKELTKLACASGVDAIKFQIYTGDTLVNPLEDKNRNTHFKKFELSKDQYIELAKLCNDNDVIFTSSVWDLTAFNWIDKYMPFYKIGSGDLTAYPLLKSIARLGKPIILSTGLSTFDEVASSVNFLQNENSIYKRKENLALLQCTSMYPIELDEANLAVIENYKDNFNLTIGYSDHTIGSVAVKQALSKGAEIIEMHFTDSRDHKVFRDHKVSFTKQEIIELIGFIKTSKKIDGSYKKKPLFTEVDSGHLTSFRRAVYPSKKIKKGEVLAEDNITVLRPNNGISAVDYYKLLGKKVNKNLNKHEKLEWDYIID